MSSTYSETYTTTFTEARARAVMRSVLGDFTAMKNAGLLTADRAEKWHEGILCALNEEALDMFQIVFLRPDGVKVALDYQIKDDGSLSTNQRPGGINYAALPRGTAVGITVSLRPGARAYQRVLRQLERQGWGTNGTIMTGDSSVDRQYSQSGYGLLRQKVGPWP